jgi:beta-lactamase class A
MRGSGKTNLGRGIILIVLAIALVAVGFFWGKSATKKTNVEVQSVTYPLLNPKIFANHPNDYIINFTFLRKSLESKFNTLQGAHSFYFEYLPTGTSIDIAGENEQVAASLIKLPLVMNLYKTAELGRIDLNQKTQLTQEDLDPSYGDLYKKGPSYELTLKEAAKLALTESDNTASRAIYRNIKDKLSHDEESLANLDINYDVEQNEAVMSTRSYSSILKCLHLSCYLSLDDSNNILSLLTQTDFTDRIPAGVGKDIKVAHKIGTYNPTESQSDCGIIYLPSRPYIMCIMMHGTEDQAAQFMSSVSKEVYNWLSKQ